MTTTTILELAVCTITDSPAAEKARRAAMQAVKTYTGFVSWRALTALDAGDMIADLVEWADKESADAAAAKVQADPAFAPYMAAISGVSLMQHFKTQDAI
jgi:ABC-type branched-subunit amino acid transport system substrate-binding protein